MQRELAGGHLVLDHGVIEQHLEYGGVFRIGKTPSDDPPTEDVDNDIEIEISPLGGSHQLGDVLMTPLIFFWI